MMTTGHRALTNDKCSIDVCSERPYKRTKMILCQTVFDETPETRVRATRRVENISSARRDVNLRFMKPERAFV